MQKPLDKSRIIPIKTNCVTSYHWFDTSVDPKAKSRSVDRFYADIRKHKGITKGIAYISKKSIGRIEFCFWIDRSVEIMIWYYMIGLYVYDSKFVERFLHILHVLSSGLLR